MQIINKFGYSVTFEVTGSTLPPGVRGIGGSSMNSWMRLNQGHWVNRYVVPTELDWELEKKLDEASSKEEFESLLRQATLL